jgi:hypothetical protein
MFSMVKGLNKVNPLCKHLYVLLLGMEWYLSLYWGSFNKPFSWKLKDKNKENIHL